MRCPVSLDRSGGQQPTAKHVFWADARSFASQGTKASLPVGYPPAYTHAHESRIKSALTPPPYRPVSNLEDLEEMVALVP